MLAIPQSFLDQLKMSCDIESIVSGYVSLRRSGRTSKGLCPFHSEKTPSFLSTMIPNPFIASAVEPGVTSFRLLCGLKTLGISTR